MNSEQQQRANAPSFTKWFASPANPLSRASDSVKYFAADALKAAFEAGMEYQKRLSFERSHPKPFSFED